MMSTGWLLIPISLVLMKAWRIAYPRVKVRLEFKKQDCWVGLFWERKPCGEQHVWICLLPMLPIHFWWEMR